MATLHQLDKVLHDSVAVLAARTYVALLMLAARHCHRSLGAPLSTSAPQLRDALYRWLVPRCALLRWLLDLGEEIHDVSARVTAPKRIISLDICIDTKDMF